MTTPSPYRLTPPTPDIDQQIRDAEAGGDQATANRLKTRRDYEALRREVRR